MNVPPKGGPVHEQAERERVSLLELLESWLETPMLVLGLVWLALLVVEVAWGLTPLLEAVGTLVWVVFVVEFLLRFSLAPRKLHYLRRNWLTAISLVVPALRVFRIFRAVRVLRVARATRSFRLIRVVGTMNRGMRALGASMARRGLGYVIAITFVVLIAGAAGMYAFEREVEDPRGLHDFGSALWWTAMVLVTMGSEYWPKTVEGRLLCLFLATYAFAVFGYLTAALASYFVDRDAESKDAQLAGQSSIEDLRQEIARLRADLQADRGRAE